MKRAYISLIILMLATLPTMAQQIIVEKNGNKETIEFAKLDKITFSGTTVKIQQTDGTATDTPMGDIDRIRFSNYSNIMNFGVENNCFVSYISNDAIAVNCNAGETVTIYNIIGTELICIRQKSANGIISIAQLPKGIYIIKSNDQTAKFVKR
jgi:hypothetical protein